MCLFIWMIFWLLVVRSRNTNYIFDRFVNVSKIRVQLLIWRSASLEKKELDFLGHRVSRHGVKPPPNKIAAIRVFPNPETIKGLQEFIWMVNFYHRFLPSAAKVMQPLYNALTGKKKEVTWTQEMENAFIDAKNLLSNATILVLGFRFFGPLPGWITLRGADPLRVRPAEGRPSGGSDPLRSGGSAHSPPLQVVQTNSWGILLLLRVSIN